MYRMIMISCYFGTLPDYFPLFLRSVSMNPTVDLLIVTDGTVKDPPPNVRVFWCTFEEVRERIAAVVEFPIVLDKPYKLCDYRPVWPLAFRDLLEGYDFWGHCDLDMLCGDIRRFLPDEVLATHDRIYQSGHLCFYRNTDEVAQRYRLDGGVDYRTVFTSPDSFAFDEFAGMGNIYSKHGFPAYCSRDHVDITYRRVRFTRTDFHVPAEELPTNNYRHQVFYWEKGKVYRAYLKDGQIFQEEFNYIHFSGRKMPNNGVKEDQQAFFITSSGFWAKTGPITKADLLRYEPYRLLPESIRYLRCKWHDIKCLWRYYWGILKGKLPSRQPLS